MRLVTTLDTLSALYHRRAGMTHLIVEPLPEILSVLAQAPSTMAELMVKLGIEYGLEQNLQSAHALQARLDELEAIGLVWRQ